MRCNECVGYKRGGEKALRDAWQQAALTQRDAGGFVVMWPLMPNGKLN